MLSATQFCRAWNAGIAGAFRQANVYNGLCAQRADPAAQPVQQAVKLELVINLEAAKTLSLTFPVTPARASRRGDRMKRRHVIMLLGAAGSVIAQPPVVAQTFLTYNCRDGSEFVVAFFEGDRSAHLQLDGKAIALPRRLSTSGSRYAKGDITLRITKTVTILRRGKRSTECAAV